MISHSAYQAACRARAKTLSVCSTGSIAMSATASGYVRTAGSFITDGFAVGMELVAASFTKAANNGAKPITAISADGRAISCLGCVAEGSAAGRTLSVGLPLTRRYMNVVVDTEQGVPYFTEQYIPGPSKVVTLGPLGEIELTPMYSGAFSVPEGTGEAAAASYINAFLTLFTPRTALALPSGEALRVRTDTGPFPSQLLAGEPGFAVQTAAIPLWIRTPNSI